MPADSESKEAAMGVGRSIRDAVRGARDSRGGKLGVGGAVVVALGVFLGWLAGRRSAEPPVRVSGVAENLPRTADAPRPPTA
jgi:hypothetical protein